VEELYQISWILSLNLFLGYVSPSQFKKNPSPLLLQDFRTEICPSAHIYLPLSPAIIVIHEAALS
jgi:hypothetical protein